MTLPLKSKGYTTITDHPLMLFGKLLTNLYFLQTTHVWKTISEAFTIIVTGMATLRILL